MNKVFLIGNITQDLELKNTTTGKKVMNFAMATNKRIKKNDKYEQISEFHNLTAWGKTAEIIEQYLKKGSKLSIVGELQTQSWEAEDGTKRYKTLIIVNEVEFLGGGKKQEEQEDKFAPKKQDSGAVRKTTPKDEQEISIEDVPF